MNALDLLRAGMAKAPNLGKGRRYLERAASLLEELRALVGELEMALPNHDPLAPIADPAAVLEDAVEHLQALREGRPSPLRTFPFECLCGQGFDWTGFGIRSDVEINCAGCGARFVLTGAAEGAHVLEEIRTCRVCGCTDDDCSGCLERTGEPCTWVGADLCSACQSDGIESAAKAAEELDF